MCTVHLGVGGGGRLKFRNFHQRRSSAKNGMAADLRVDWRWSARARAAIGPRRWLERRGPSGSCGRRVGRPLCHIIRASVRRPLPPCPVSHFTPRKKTSALFAPPPSTHTGSPPHRIPEARVKSSRVESSQVESCAPRRQPARAAGRSTLTPVPRLHRTS